MPRLRLGMRWWLAAIFVLIAALTAALVATVSSRQADRALRDSSQELAIGKTVSAGFLLERAISGGHLDESLPLVAARRGLALFVFDPAGRLLTADVSNGVAWTTLPHRRRVLAEALRGHRVVDATSGAMVVALPLRRTATAAALVAYAPRPAAFGASAAIFHHEVGRAALWAVLAAAAAGLLAATLIARRLQRIGAAAAAIERGDFDMELRSTFGDEVGALAMSIDRMRRRLRAAFDEVSAERDRLRRLLEQLHEGVLAVDARLTVQFMNRAARRLLAAAHVREGERVPDVWAGLALGDFAAALFRQDAELAEARVTPVENQTLAVVGVPAGASALAVLVLTDITEQQRRERAEREFVANASHELRTPVSAIVGAVEALEAGAKDVPAERDRFVALIGRQAERLGRLTRSLLLLARAQTHQEELELQPVALRPLLEDVAGATGANGRITLDCPPGIAALAHPDLAEQIVLNLLGNALTHSDGGPVELRVHEDADAVVIEVADRGGGIPQDVQQRIFDRFYSGGRGRRDGFGLGLAIARDAVQALGGAIELESSTEGTVARVMLARSRGR